MRSCKLDYKRPSYHVDETEERKTEKYVTLQEAILMYLIQCHARMLLILTLSIHNIHFYIPKRSVCQFRKRNREKKNQIIARIWVTFVDLKRKTTPRNFRLYSALHKEQNSLEVNSGCCIYLSCVTDVTFRQCSD